jgi:hypothetical protein
MNYNTKVLPGFSTGFLFFPQLFLFFPQLIENVYFCFRKSLAQLNPDHLRNSTRITCASPLKSLAQVSPDHLR